MEEVIGNDGASKFWCGLLDEEMDWTRSIVCLSSI